VQDQLEDLAHRGVVDRARILLDDLLQDLFLALGVEDRHPGLGLYPGEVLHDLRPLAERPDQLQVDLVDPLP
jgi:hypothetical protein